MVGDHFRDRLLPPLFIEDVQVRSLLNAGTCGKRWHQRRRMKVVTGDVGEGAPSMKGAQLAERHQHRR